MKAPDKLNDMMRIRNIMILLALTLLSAPAFGQYDDMYYNPDTDQNYYNYDDTYAQDRSSNRSYSNARMEDLEQFRDGDQYDYYNDYDFYYTSRIRRFHRPLYGFGYYDPVYTDAYYYDPFLNPGNAVLIYDDYFSYRDWVRWGNWRRWGWNATRFNRWDFCWGGNRWGNRWGSPWGWNSFGANRWYRPGFHVSVGVGFNSWGFNSWGGNPYWGFDPYYGGGWFNSYPGAWWGGNRWSGNYNYAPGWSNGNEYSRDVYYGPRTGGGAVGPGPGGRNRVNGINPGTIRSNDRNTDIRRDLNGRVTTRPGDRINTGNQRDRYQTTERSRNSRIDDRRSTPSRIGTTTPRTRTNTATERSRAGRNTSTNSQSRTGRSTNSVEGRRLGGEVIPVTPNNNAPARTERYRRPSRSGAATRTAPSTRTPSQSYDGNRSTGRSSYPGYSSGRSRSSSSGMRSSTPSRSRSGVGSSSSTRSRSGVGSSSSTRSRSSIGSSSRSGSSSSMSRSSSSSSRSSGSSSAGRKRGSE